MYQVCKLLAYKVYITVCSFRFYFSYKVHYPYRKRALNRVNMNLISDSSRFYKKHARCIRKFPFLISSLIKTVKMKELHSQNVNDYQVLLYNSIRPIYFISKVLGLSPWCLQSVNGRLEFTASAGGVLYTVVMLLVFLLWQVYIITWRVKNDYVDASFTYIVPQLVSICSSSLTTIAALLVTITLGRKNMEKIIHKISEVDSSLFSSNDAVFKKSQNILTVEVLLLLAVTGALYGYDMWIWFGVKGDNYVVYRGLVYLVNALTVMQYINFVHLLQHRFKVLNTRIQATTIFDKSITSNDFRKQRNAIASAYAHRNSVGPLEISKILEEKVFDVGSGSISENSQENQDITFHKYREVYSILHEIASLVNSTYGFQNLLQFITIFIVIVKGLYFLLTTLEDPSVTKVNSEMQFHAAVLVLLWALYHAFQLFWISISCDKSCSEATATGAVVQKLLLKKLDYESQSELNAFANQLLHSKIIFTAFGFFSVNLNILCSISGAIMTYTIILNQAQSRADSVISTNCSK